MTDSELREYYEWFMAAVPERMMKLSDAVVKSPGFEMFQGDYSPGSLDTLGSWFARQVETRPKTDVELKQQATALLSVGSVPPDELTERTFSLAMDLGMYLSQVFLKQNPSLKWLQPLGDRMDADFGQPVLVGFGRVPMNPVRLLVTLAYGIACGKQDGTRLRSLFDYWAQRVSKG
jgi:hypothetical protein